MIHFTSYPLSLRGARLARLSQARAVGGLCWGGGNQPAQPESVSKIITSAINGVGSPNEHCVDQFPGVLAVTDVVRDGVSLRGGEVTPYSTERGFTVAAARCAASVYPGS